VVRKGTALKKYNSRGRFCRFLHRHAERSLGPRAAPVGAPVQFGSPSAQGGLLQWTSFLGKGHPRIPPLRTTGYHPLSPVTCHAPGPFAQQTRMFSTRLKNSAKKALERTGQTPACIGTHLHRLLQAIKAVCCRHLLPGGKHPRAVESMPLECIRFLQGIAACMSKVAMHPRILAPSKPFLPHCDEPAKLQRIGEGRC
jgi:hypothetical protein